MASADGAEQAAVKLQTGFSKRTQDRLSAMQTDCRIRARDGTSFELHKGQLVIQSMVFRQMISDVAANEFPLDEDVNNVQLLIDGMYNANASMTEHNVDKCLELARKYDVADMHDNCAHFLVAVPLTVQNLPRWLALAAAYNVDAALQKCQAFVAAGDNFKAIVSIHGELFYKTLPAAQITTMLAARLRALEAALAAEKADGKVYRAACNVYHDCLEKAATTAAKSKPAQVYSIPSGTVTYITLEDTTVQYIVREVQDMARSNGPAVRQLMPK